MGANKPPRYHHGDLRRALIDGAARLIARRRDVAFTLRELAQAAQVSHAAAYRHFANKADILAAVAEVGFGRLQAEFVAVSAPLRRDPKRELRALGLAYLQFALQHAGFYRAMFHHELGDHRAYPSLNQVADAAFHSLLDAVTRGVEQGTFRRRPPRELAMFAWSTVHGLASLLIDGLLAADSPDPKQDPAALSEMILDCVVRGLLA
jgi:AcrR family transcriptional regulator